MSMRSYANHGYIIPMTILTKNLPEVMEYINANLDEWVSWVQDDYEEQDEAEDKSIHFQECTDKILAWGRSVDLKLTIDYTGMDEDNEEEHQWMCFCDNAFTLNPAFKAAGGESILWTTWG